MVRLLRHLAEVYGSQVSKETISTITDRVLDGMGGWQNRPLDSVYPVMFIGAVNVKIRDDNVANRPIYIALAVTGEGTRDVLGIWAGEHGEGEGAKYWLRVLTEIKNRGVNDVLIIVCDGLKGLPEAINQVWPKTIVQTCIVHYSDTAVMPMLGRGVLVGGGEWAGGIGIIRGLRGTRGADLRAL
jgi:putative transposase